MGFLFDFLIKGGIVIVQKVYIFCKLFKKHMKKLIFITMASLLIAVPVLATVTVNSGPTSLVTSPMTVEASSDPIALFSLDLSQDAGETLSSVTVEIDNTASSTATALDLASVSVYQDEGDGTFDSGTDLLAGSQTTVNIDGSTMITASSNNTIATSSTVFFVALATSSTWSDATPTDSITVTLPADGITTSANSPTVTAVTTSSITADTTGPALSTALAQNTGGTNAKEVGDSVKLTFSEETNKPSITSVNIDTTFVLNNGHSFLDSLGGLGATSWSTDGKTLTVTLGMSASSTLPTVEVGDTVTLSGDLIIDLLGNVASGVQTITGTFSGEETPGGPGSGCSNDLINGRLYQIGSDETVYLAAACALKEFKGNAVGNAQGNKFQNIIILSSMPEPGTNIAPGQSESGETEEEEGETTNGESGETESQTQSQVEAQLQNVSSTNVVRNLVQERNALKIYGKIFKHMPQTSAQWMTLNYLAYGGDVIKRNIAAERLALHIYVLTFGNLPSTSEDWITLHVIAYGS